jgi:hypothetical protein
MALTLSSKSQYVEGDRKVTYITLAFDNSYATGGLSLTPAQLGFKNLYWIDISQTSGYTFQYSFSTNKILVYWCGGSGAVQSQVTNATDLSTLTGVRVRAEGK